MANYTCNTPSPTLPSHRARHLGVPHCTNLKSDKRHLTGKVYAPKKQWGVGMLLSQCVAVISLVAESVCLSGSCCFPGHWAQGIYTKLPSSIVKDLPRVEGPPCSDVIFNDGCHVLRRHVTSGWWSFLLLPVPSLCSSGSLCVCIEQQWGDSCWIPFGLHFNKFMSWYISCGWSVVLFVTDGFANLTLFVRSYSLTSDTLITVLFDRWVGIVKLPQCPFFFFFFFHL